MELTGFLFFLGLVFEVKVLVLRIVSSSRCLDVEVTGEDGFRVEVQAAQADLLLELPLEEAPALLLLVEALTAPVAPVHTVRVPATARLTARAHPTDQTLALPLTAQDLVSPQVQFSTPQQQHPQEEGLMEAGTREGHRVQENMLCNIKDMSLQDTTSRTPTHGLLQVPGAVR